MGRTVRGLFRKVYSDYRRKAEKKGLIFDISYIQFLRTVKSNCYYCQKMPMRRAPKAIDGIFYMNGIDRLDSTKGYIDGNIVPCCMTCNKMKSDLSKRDFVNAIKKIYENFF